MPERALALQAIKLCYVDLAWCRIDVANGEPESSVALGWRGCVSRPYSERSGSLRSGSVYRSAAFPPGFDDAILANAVLSE